jgi:glycosyltransferase involved in cell wall biosynthesis
LSSKKVIHIVENLHRGAVENWLVRMFLYAKERGVSLDWTFYSTLPRAGKLDSKLLAAGAKVIHSPVGIGATTRFIAALRRELVEGRYDVMHCHHDIMSGLYLASAIGVPIGLRLVHVHNADEVVLTPNRAQAILLRWLFRNFCFLSADRIVAISQHTLETFLHGRRRTEARHRVHYYGVDGAAFIGVEVSPEAFRRDLNLPSHTRILLFAGRLVPEKNPVFVVEVLADLLRFEPDAAGVFVGDGSSSADVIARAEQLGISERIRLLGWRDDVPAIMKCCDWFILPRPELPMEGFGLAVVEAQLAGLRLLLSLGVTDEPLLPTCCFDRLPLASGPTAWAMAAIRLLKGCHPSTEEATRALQNSPLAMDFALFDLLGLYGGAMQTDL